MRYYKILTTDGKPHHGGFGRWHLPHGKRPGKWMPRIKQLMPCLFGYHVCQRSQVVCWLGPVIWTCEIDGETIRGDNKVVVERARLLYQIGGWNEKTQRLFACDCAERVLPLYEKEHPSGTAPRRALEVARVFAEGRATRYELNNASIAAYAAYAATSTAALAISAARADVYAALAAAYIAAYAAYAATAERAAAVCTAAGLAASATNSATEERRWQTRRLFKKYLVVV